MMTSRLTRGGGILVVIGFAFFSGLPSILLASPAPNNQFTVEVITPNTSQRALIETNASWRYFKGISEPNPGWSTADENALGSGWQSNAAGFGFGDGNDATVLSDMQNGYSTLYIRTTFSHNRVLDPKRVKFKVDYDDGFIAYLDGTEFARVNVPGEPGQGLPANSSATASHKASHAAGGNPAETYYFDTAFPALFPHSEESGPSKKHVLAIQGLNRTIGDDEFSLLPALYLEGFFTVVETDSVELAGRINLVGATEVSINGEPAVLDVNSKNWSGLHPLRPGLNRLIIEARDCDDNVLASLTKDVLTKGTPRLVSGTLSGNASWDSAAGVVELTDSVNVGAGVTLTIGQGTTVLFRPGTSLRTTSGTINVNGTSNNPVYFLPADAETPWEGIEVSGAGSALTLRFAEVVAGAIHMSDHAIVLLEDTMVRDYSYTAAGPEDYIIHSLGNCQFTARRSVFSRYYTMAFGGRPSLYMEDCLFEYSEHDFFKPQDTTADSYVRRCTFAHSSVAGTDGVDTGAGATFTVDNCLFHDIPDKAISIEASDITVSNCLLYNIGTGLAVKDDSTATLINSTIANATYGIAVYLKNPGAVFARAVVTNSIVWENNTNITLRNPEDGSSSPNTTIMVRYSDVGGGYSGAGNINRDPRFINTPSGDFRLAAGSPALAAGSGGADMGALLPAGVSLGPVLLQQPLSQTAGLDSNVILRVRAMGSPPVIYQWLRNDMDIPGATSSSLVVSNLNAAREGVFHVLVTSGGSSVNSSPAVVLLNNPLRINYSATATCGYHLRLLGPAGKDFVLQTSSNLFDWIPVATGAAPMGIVEFNEVGLPNIPVRFYRVAEAP